MSGDGKSWTTVGSATVTLPGNVLVGVALTSHDDSALATASLDNVGVKLSRRGTTITG